jgi:putative transcriptional regulator
VALRSAGLAIAALVVFAGPRLGAALSSRGDRPGGRGLMWGGDATIAHQPRPELGAAQDRLAPPDLGVVPARQLQRGDVKELAPGKLLVAARHLPDPNFTNSVVLLAEFNEKGAMGLIVNRPTDVTLARLFPDLDPSREHARTVFFGGPVYESGVLALFRSSSERPNTHHVVSDVYLVNTRDALQELIGAGTGSDRLRVFVGYAGWGAGQLEQEASQGAWHVIAGEGRIVFDDDPDTVWDRQIKITEALVARSRPSEEFVPPVHGRHRGAAPTLSSARLK